MSYPECMAAANRVLRAAETWRELMGDKRAYRKEVAELIVAVDAYQATGQQAQVNIPKEIGD